MRIFNFVAVIRLLLFTATISCTTLDENPERIFSKITFIDSIELELPLRRIMYHEENFFSYDYYSKSLLKQDKNFEIIDSLGKWGNGPKENLLVRNYQPIQNNKIMIFDTEKHSFKVQDFSDSVYLYHKFTSPVERGVALNDSLLITIASRPDFKLGFSYYDLGKSESQSIDELNILFDEVNSGLIYEGKLQIEGDFVVHTSYFANHWFVFNYNTNDLKIGSYRYEFENPKVLDFGGGIMLDNAPELISDTFLHDSKLFVISNVGERDFPEQRVLDIYDLKTASYINSYILPKFQDSAPSEGFYIQNDRIGLRYEDFLYIFQLE
ncbi:hypothetical protein [Algoriphagus hitonicola]|uniref:TolB-like 6-blade propeller-like n=1 Tax=Algoriphagus hitonicola TaxID=435880 RepID=A0A1I2U3E3_9BACT|nr:hypothetical protein [Algoriphagus hitonicola]SFG71594.1 hypothetical protein SAMN04487988_10721 [Algoriphagus hitonicola]